MSRSAALKYGYILHLRHILTLVDNIKNDILSDLMKFPNYQCRAGVGISEQLSNNVECSEIPTYIAI